MRIIPLLVATLLLSSISYATSIDSIKAALDGASAEESYGALLQALDGFSDLDSTDQTKLIAYCEQVELPSPRGDRLMHKATYITAKQAAAQNEFESALIQLQDLSQKLDPESEALLLSKTYKKLGDIFLSLGSPGKSLEYAQLALDVCPQDADPTMRIYILNALGETYRHIDEYKRAIHYYKEGLVIADAEKVLEPASMLLNNLGIAYAQLDAFDSAETTLQRGLAICEEIDSDFGRARLLTNLGFLFKEQDQHERALDYYTRSIEVKKRLNNPKSLAYSLNDYGEVLAQMGRFEEGLRYSREALQIVITEKAIYYERDMNLTLSNTFQAMGKYDSAYFHLNRYRQLQDSVINEDQALEIARLERLNQITETQLENSVLKSQNELDAALISKQRWLIGSFIFLSVGLIVFGLMLFRNNRARNTLTIKLEEQNKVLDSKNASLQQLLQEQESLFNIVTHDLKGPLSNILGLIDLERKEFPESEESEFKYWMQRSAENALHFIEEFNLIHELETKNEIPKANSFDLVELIRDVTEEYRSLIASKQITIHFDPPEKLIIKSVQPFVRHICLNVLSNALKFSPEGGSVFIAISQADHVRISIKDQGPGIPEKDQERIFQKFFRAEASDTSTHSSNGLGLSLVKLLVEKLNGKIRVKSSAQAGTEFVVYL